MNAGMFFMIWIIGFLLTQVYMMRKQVNGVVVYWELNLAFKVVALIINFFFWPLNAVLQFILFWTA